MKSLYAIVFCTLIVLAVVLRLSHAEHVADYSGDLGIQLLIADHTIKYGDFRLDGEISSFDSEGKYVIHNSPIGYYLYVLFYALGGQTTQGYMLVYVLQNILQAIFLFGAGFLFFGVKGGIASLTLSLFSSSALILAMSPGQPANAAFFESMAIFLFGFYIRTRKTIWFWLTCLVSLFATQLYPPMYLLLLPKVILFLLLIRRSPALRYGMRWAGVFGVLIYVPILIQEIVFGWSNVNVLLKHDAVSQTGFTISEIVNRIAITMQIIFSYISWSTSNVTVFVFFVLVTIVFATSKKVDAKRRLIIAGIILFPIVLLAFHPIKPYVIPKRAYLLVLTPYILLFGGSLVSKFPRFITYSISMLYIVWAMSAYPSSLMSGPKVSLPELQTVTDSIFQTSEINNLNVSVIDLFVISPMDSWNWEATLYWYELERLEKKRLSRVDYITSKGKRTSTMPIQVIYLICHRMTREKIDSQCVSVFENDRMMNVYDRSYRRLFSQQFENVAYYAYGIR